MKPLTINDVEWTVTPLCEEVPLEGNVLASGDDDEDRAAEEEIRQQYENGNEWAWCTIRVTGRYKVLSASTYLGCCSYASERDFCSPGGDGYYQSMQREVLDELNATLADRQ